jgi:hypothetical protein
MNALEAAYALVEVVATPLAIAAWPVAFGLTLLLGRGLRGQLGPHRRAVWSVFVFSLVVHLLDTGLTLYITPDLALEALYDQLPNPFVAAFVWGLALAPAFYVVGWRAHRARTAGAAG